MKHVNRLSRSSKHGCHILQLNFTNNKTNVFVPIYLTPESISELQAAEKEVINYHTQTPRVGIFFLPVLLRYN